MFPRLRRVMWKTALLTTVLSLVGFTGGLAASGNLDPTFSGDGKQTTDFFSGRSEEIRGIALQADGKIVAVGHRWDASKGYSDSSHNFALARYKTNGSLDATFSGDGKQLTDFSRSDEAQDVALQANRKIVVSGSTCSTTVCHLALARYTSSGGLDTTFSGDGKQVLTFGSKSNETYGGLAIQPDGKIVAGGLMVNASGDDDFAVYRLTSSGNLDPTFSGDGRASLSFGVGRREYVLDIVLQSGKTLVVGRTCNASWSHCDIGLARLTQGGALDPTFGTGGKVITDFAGNEDAGVALALQSNGKIIVAGGTYSGTAYYMALARYTPNGVLDTTFSGDGRQTVSVGTRASATDVLVQADGKIVVGGVSDSGVLKFALVRLNPNGNLDTTFSGDGKVVIGFGRALHIAESLLRQEDGKYVLAGSACNAELCDFALARVLP